MGEGICEGMRESMAKYFTSFISLHSHFFLIFPFTSINNLNGSNMLKRILFLVFLLTVFVSAQERSMRSMQEDIYIEDNQAEGFSIRQMPRADYVPDKNPMQKRVLFEEGTNSSCPSCAGENPFLKSFLEQQGDSVLLITYHAWWPGNTDPMYKANVTQNTQWINYYSINYVPYLCIDGIYRDIYPFSHNLLQTPFQQRINSAVALGITVNDERLEDDSIRSTITVDIPSDLPAGNYKLKVAAVEELIEYSSPPGNNGEKEFENVFRKAYPDLSGITINPAQGSYTFVYTYAVPVTWVDSSIFTLAYVQNEQNKEILNSSRGSYVANPYIIAARYPMKGASSVELNPVIDWSDASAAKYYRFEMSTDSLFVTTSVSAGDLLLSEYALDSLEEGSIAYWRVELYNDSANYGFSTVKSFTVKLYDATELEATLIPQPYITWKDNSGQETGYQIERGTFSGGKVKFKVIETLAANSESYTDFGVTNPEKIWYRVKAVNEKTSSWYGDTVSVDFVSSVKEGVAPKTFLLSQNYPNPFNPTTAIYYEIPEAGTVSLKVFDVMGNEVADLVRGKQEAGGHRVTFDAGDIASGVYFYSLRLNGSLSAVRKMMLLR